MRGRNWYWSRTNMDGFRQGLPESQWGDAPKQETERQYPNSLY